MGPHAPSGKELFMTTQQKSDLLKQIKLPTVKVPWGHISRLVRHFSETESDILLIYSSETQELCITDHQLYRIMDGLSIPYEKMQEAS